MRPSSAEARARRALLESHRISSGGVADASGYVRSLEENLLPDLPAVLVARLRTMLAAGAGQELQGSDKRSVPSAFAVHSSAVLVLNSFAAWVDDARGLTLSGIDCAGTPPILEHKLRIKHGGGTPNYDAFVTISNGSVVAVESKLTEHLKAKRHLSRRHGRYWSDTYRKPGVQQLLEPAWRELLVELVHEERPAVTHLDREQLVKHALGLRSHHPGKAALVYVFWEPSNGDEVPEVVAHRDEVAAFAARVGGADPMFTPISWRELWTEWDGRDESGGWGAWGPQVRARYDLALS